MGASTPSLPYRRGFDCIAQHLLDREGGGSRYPLRAVELRLPEQVTFAVFGAFNQGYQALLAEWDLLLDGVNPVARTNAGAFRYRRLDGFGGPVAILS